MSTKNSKDVKQIKQQTPTPMRKMEDPSLWHVMRSRSTRKQQSGVMKPPPPKKKKIVLDEDEYLETMGKVIERDYFPDLDKCRTHYEVGLGLFSLIFSIYKQLSRRTLTEQNG